MLVGRDKQATDEGFGRVLGDVVVEIAGMAEPVGSRRGLSEAREHGGIIRVQVVEGELGEGSVEMEVGGARVSSLPDD
jgi:hypothetical protein